MVLDGNQFNDIGRLLYGESGCTTVPSLNHFDHGLYMSGTRVMVRNNIFYNMRTGWLIQLYPDASDYVWIYGNTLAGHCQTQENGQIIVYASVTHLEISNNIFLHARGSVVHAGTSITGEFTNNLVDLNIPAFDTSQPGMSVSANLLGADLPRRQKPDRFRELGLGGAVRIGFERVASAA